MGGILFFSNKFVFYQTLFQRLGILCIHEDRNVTQICLNCRWATHLLFREKFTVGFCPENLLFLENLTKSKQLLRGIHLLLRIKILKEVQEVNAILGYCLCSIPTDGMATKNIWVTINI